MKRYNPKFKFDKVLVLLLVILVVAVAAQFFLYKNNDLDVKDSSQAPRNQDAPVAEDSQKAGVGIKVDFGQGKVFNETVNADTPFAALERLSSNQGFNIVTKEYKYGLMVEGINRINNTPEKVWSYKVNDQPGAIAADRYILAPGDNVEWIYSGVK